MIMTTSPERKRGARLGQHFLTGQWAARKLAAAVSVRAGETILEIGPGKGALSRELLAKGAKVVAVEKDEALVGQLAQTFAVEIASGKLVVVGDDIRNFDPTTFGFAARGYVVAANIPYYITGEIIRQFLTAAVQPRAMALLVQKEVAERIIARDGKESILSLSVKAYGSPKLIAKVSRGNFSPPPSVDSAILLVDDISKRFFSDVSEKEFFTVVRAGFASKRKFLANNLGGQFGKENVLKAFIACKIDEKTRAENVHLNEWRHLAKEIISPASE
jgi:16S rRNA (adenine1518-N6/adenine1519-N6)-dimethyltransferase